MGAAIVDIVQRHPWLVIVLAGIVLIGVLAAIDGLTKIARARAFEHSRREIAAYVAEGSIAPEDAAKLLSRKDPGRKDPGRRLAQALSWGGVNKREVDALVKIRAEVDDDAWGEMVDLVTGGMEVDPAIRLVRSRRAPSTSPNPA